MPSNLKIIQNKVVNSIFFLLLADLRLVDSQTLPYSIQRPFFTLLITKPTSTPTIHEIQA